MFFLIDCLITYAERGIAEKFDTDSIFDEIYDANEVRDLDKQYDAFNFFFCSLKKKK